MEKTTTHQKGLKNLMGAIDYTKRLYPDAKAEKKAQAEEKKGIGYDDRMNLQSRLYYANNYMESLSNILQEMELYFDLDESDDGNEILEDMKKIQEFIPPILSGITAINGKLEAME